MRVNERTIELIKKFEGCRLTAYKDAVGVWTIGYGHTAGVEKGMTITQEQAEDLLKEDLKKYAEYVKKYVTTFEPNENQFGALTSFCYNCGAGNLKTLVRGRDAETISSKILLYNKAGGKVLVGLVNRRIEEQELFNTPVSGENRGADATDKKTDFIKGVQSATGAKVDGIAGKETISKTVTISKKKNSKHTVVKAVQEYLNDNGYSCGKADGIFGTKTHDAVVAYQKEVLGYKNPDGEITAGNKTWKKLLGLI